MDSSPCWVGLHVELPAFLHSTRCDRRHHRWWPVGGLAGFLKARTRAHGDHHDHAQLHCRFLRVVRAENVSFPGARLQPAPVGPHLGVGPAAHVVGAQYRINISFLIALAAVFFVEWLLFRSTIGFEFRAAGFSPSASAYAGMNVAFLYTTVMFISGALAGLAGATMTLGLPPYTVTAEFPGDDWLRCDRPRPPGAVTSIWCALVGPSLRGADHGGRTMQAAAVCPSTSSS